MRAALAIAAVCFGADGQQLAASSIRACFGGGCVYQQLHGLRSRPGGGRAAAWGWACVSCSSVRRVPQSLHFCGSPRCANFSCGPRWLHASHADPGRWPDSVSSLPTAWLPFVTGLIKQTTVQRNSGQTHRDLHVSFLADHQSQLPDKPPHDFRRVAIRSLALSDRTQPAHQCNRSGPSNDVRLPLRRAGLCMRRVCVEPLPPRSLRLVLSHHRGALPRTLVPGERRGVRKSVLRERADEDAAVLAAIRPRCCIRSSPATRS